ncbi:MAG: helix-turn-helix domain-containing protein, partial [Eubacteriales bacterium]
MVEDAMNCTFIAQQMEKEHIHLDIELFYVINGKVRFYLENKEFVLAKDDYLIVNTDTMHSACVEGDALACRIEIPFLELSNLTSRNSFVFWCNSVTDSGEAYDYARDIIRKIIWEEHQENLNNKIYLASLYYQLLDILVNDFSVDNGEKRINSSEHKFDERKQQIEDYIRKNYNKEISLQELADNLYLSVAYLSKYIKKQFGISFIEYVNNLRFNAAVSQLLYSDKSVLRIAMDNGFPSSATLNKMFKERYGKTPTEFRSEWRDKEIKKSNTVDEEKKIRERINTYFEQNPGERHDREMTNYESVTLSQSENVLPLQKSWNKMINIGTATDLLNSNVQKHVLSLKAELNIQYVRFWDLYAEEMFLFRDDEQRSFNFDTLDRIIDFLIDNGLKPYIELGNKKKILIKSSIKRMKYTGESVFPKIRNHLAVFMEKLIIHLINRYTPEEVESWYFELWKKENESFDDVTPEYEQINRDYLDIFETVYEVFHRYVPGCNV